MRTPVLMTPGPTRVAENVRMARALECTNPDMDKSFTELYKKSCDKIASLLYTNNDVRILSGEGILGLEAACASLTEEGDRVLVLDNGIFGEGFADFVTMYGGEAVFFKSDWKKEIDIEMLKQFLEQDHSFKYATIVHCDTPTGVLNPIEQICPLLKQYDILTVVDSVAAMIGEPIKVDAWQIDIALGGSQKCISAPIGLTFLSISQDAWQAIESRKTKVIGFYCDLNIWRDCIQKAWYPYSMPISDIKALDVALDNIIEEGIEKVWARHAQVAEYIREGAKELGLKLYLTNGFSNTVTAIEIEHAQKIRQAILQGYNIMLGGSLGHLDETLIRIGHMGENCYMEDARLVLGVLKEYVKKRV